MGQDSFTNLQRNVDSALRKANPPTDLISFLRYVQAADLTLQRATFELYHLTGLEVAFSSIKDWTEKLLTEEVAS